MLQQVCAARHPKATRPATAPLFELACLMSLGCSQSGGNLKGPRNCPPITVRKMKFSRANPRTGRLSRPTRSLRRLGVLCNFGVYSDLSRIFLAWAPKTQSHLNVSPRWQDRHLNNRNLKELILYLFLYLRPLGEQKISKAMNTAKISDFFRNDHEVWCKLPLGGKRLLSRRKQPWVLQTETKAEVPDS